MNKLPLLLTALFILAGCMPTSITRQPSIDVVAVTNKYSLTLSGDALSPREKASVSNFIARQGMLSNLMVKIEKATQKGESQLEKVRLHLIKSGLYPSQIWVSNKLTQGKGDLTILVESYRSKVLACSAGNPKTTIVNAYHTQHNFGCSNANALAQMIANPKDLIVAQPIDNTQGKKAVSRIDSYFEPSTQSQQINPVSPNTALGGSQ